MTLRADYYRYRKRRYFEQIDDSYTAWALKMPGIFCSAPKKRRKQPEDYVQ
jgi:hypothetical protein